MLLTLLLLFFVAFNLAAQTSFTVTLGTSSNYQIDRKSNIIEYTWEVFTDRELTSQAGISQVELRSPGAGRENEIEILWKEEGTYFLSVSVLDNESCSNKMAFQFEVESDRYLAVDANSYCLKDAPFVDYLVTPVNFESTEGLTVDISWFDSRGVEVLTLADQPLNGTLLWPGAETDESGQATDWPGWIVQNGRWVEGADGFEYSRDGSTIRFSINRDTTINVLYPPATPDCSLAPDLVLADDVRTTLSGRNLVFDVLNNDSGVGSLYPVTIIDQPVSGSLVPSGRGVWTYIPDEGFTGNDTIVYQVEGPGGSGTARVIITVEPSLVLIANAFCVGDIPHYSWQVDYEGQQPSSVDITIYDSVGNVVVSLEDTSLTGSGIWPEAQASAGQNKVYGTPQMLEVIELNVDVLRGGELEQLSARLNLPNCISNSVVAVWDSASVYSETIDLDVLANDYDPDGDEIDSASVRIYRDSLSQGPYHGEVLINENGSISYTPDPGYMGPDSFVYVVCDLNELRACDTAIVRLQLYFNDKLVANNDRFSRYIGQGGIFDLLANDFDPDGALDPASLVIISDPENGNVISNGDGTVTYQPLPDFEGTDVFTYRICDNGVPQECDTASVFVRVHENECIVAVYDRAETTDHTPVVIDVLKNDFDAEESIDTTSLTVSTAPANGSTVINDDFTITYTPAPLFAGIDSFVYTLCDGGIPVCCDTAMVYVRVINTNQVLMANADRVSTLENNEILIDVLANDYDPDGNIDPTSLQIISAPAAGSTVVNSDGSLLYTPEEGFIGRDSIIYQLCDDGPIVACDTAVIYINVTENLPPVALNDTFDVYTAIDAVLTVSLNDFDPEGALDSLSVSLVDSSQNGSIRVNPETGELVYAANYCFTGTDSVSYVIYDAAGNVSQKAWVIFNVTYHPMLDTDFDGVPDMAEDINKNGTPCDDDSDGDGIADYLDADDDDDGVPTALEDIDGDGNPMNDDTDGDGIPNYLDVDDDDDCVLTINEDYNGNGDWFDDHMDNDGIPDFLDNDHDGDGLLGCEELEDRDGNGIIDVNEAWNVQAVNDVLTIGIDQEAWIPIFENDSSQLDETTLTIIQYPSNGQIEVDRDTWVINYTPDFNFLGVDSFVYEVCDLYGMSCTRATVFITIEDIVIAPQLFTPNNDGENDNYVISGLQYYPNNRFEVYNRWGNKVYSYDGYYNQWDGTSNVRLSIGSRKLPVGVYYYIITFGDGREKGGALFLER
ncbi:Ig-like domain-containing protein [Roseimarinus sediminis]|uniref:Ig-like domain-containing protein n=1 Tax=Roseimarinus sediminis TaxID=1610899 RepID=UPI003D260906